MTDDDDRIGGSMEPWRMAAAIGLSAVVFLLWSSFVAPRTESAPRPVPSASSTGPATPLSPTGGVPSAATDTALITPEAVPGGGAPAPVPEGRQVVVETPLYQARFDSLGAVQTGMALKAYPATHDPGSAPIDLVEGRSAAGLWSFDLVGQRKRQPTRNLTFEPSRDRLVLGSSERGEIVFRGHVDGWGSIEKRYTFSTDRYAITLDVSVTPDPGRPVDFGMLMLDEIGGTGKATNRWEGVNAKLAYGADGFELDTEALESLRKKARSGEEHRILYTDETRKTPIRWVGFDERYFVRVAVADVARRDSAWLTALPGRADPRGAWIEPVKLELIDPGVATRLGAPVAFRYTLYLGPKEFERLVQADPTLDRAVELGWYRSIAQFFVSTLKLFHRVTGNWGVAIIILTILVRMAMFPVMLPTMRMGKKMQALQPEMARIRETHKNDPEALNKASMELFRREKVNPASGCLPMFLQFPVFIGLYYALAQSIELRHANFALWLHDLSAPDPYYVTPLIMGGTMWLQQRMQPTTTADPTQQMMLQWMPVVFTFFFLNFPSGLVLYWMFGNLVQIAQTWWFRRTHP